MREGVDVGRRLVAGVDCSTQATKVVVVDIDSGKLVASGRVAHDVFRDGAASETDPENWWRALAGALAQTACAGEVGAISVAAQQLGIVTLDSDHRPLRRAILWDDTRSAHAAAELRRLLGGAAAWAEAVGTQPLAGLSVASWTWLRHAEPDMAKKTAFIRLPHDFLTERLTGNGVTDRGDASGTGWWSSRRETYVPEVLELPIVRVDASMLPRVLRPNEPAGEVTRKAAGHTGRPAGIPVACGTGDNMSAALALAITPGTPVISLGTSGTAYLRSDHAPADLSGQVFADASASGDHLPLTCTLNATLAVDNLARMLGLERHDVAERTGVVVMPYLSGERLPDYPLARGTIAGIDHTTTAGEILLAAVEGVAYSLVRSLDVLELNSSGIDPNAPIVLIGGGARGRVWQDAIGRLSGRELLIPYSDELVAWGAAAQAAGVLRGEAAIDVSQRWNVADGTRVPARPLDHQVTDRIARVREAAHELNAKELFPGLKDTT
jgi:xylulokinase